MPVPSHQVPSSTMKNRSVEWECGRLMLPGSQRIRITYGPGFVGSPNSTACSLVPAALRTHLMSAGATKSTALRSMSLEGDRRHGEGHDS